jgi:nicotinamide-nucleotide amidase
MEKEELFDALRKRNLTLSAMESLTGGLFSETFTSIPGASNVFVGAAVTYLDRAKESFGVSRKTIEAYGAVSANCAEEMALSARRFFHTDVSVSFTGNAGPTGSEGKPVGLVYLAFFVKDQMKTFELHLHGDRDSIRAQCVSFAFRELKAEIEQTMPITQNPAGKAAEEASSVEASSSSENKEGRE